MVKPSLPLAGYPRVSRKGDRDELRSPDFQVKRMQAFAKAEGLAIEFTEPEIDVSGSKPRRAILDEIIRRVKAGELGGIVVAKLDRLSRLSPKDRVLLFEEIESAGGVVLSASEQLDPSTPEGRFAREVFLGIARMQWEKYREGFEEAKAGAIENGIPVNTRAAVGYRKRDGDGEDRRLEIDPVAAPVVHAVFERRAQGAGPAELGELLARAGVRTSQGSTTWSKQAIYGLLSNRVYLGELSYGRDGRYVKTDAHEAIVDLALWTAAQHPNGRLQRVGETSAWLLAGLVRCDACRYCMQGTTTSRGNRIYRCTRTHAGGVCPAPAASTRTSSSAPPATRSGRSQLTSKLAGRPRRSTCRRSSGISNELPTRCASTWRRRFKKRSATQRSGRVGSANVARPATLPPNDSAARAPRRLDRPSWSISARPGSG